MAGEPEVIINGVRYLPAVDLRPATLADVRRLLIELYMGAEGPNYSWSKTIGQELYITISEDVPQTSYPDLEPTIDRFIEMATAALTNAPSPEGHAARQLRDEPLIQSPDGGLDGGGRG